ncbi:ACT domain-containing protein [Desulforamulus aquiferis]|uniref:ACT domain-containing protein n=1 Tax=Desulforamulus aquiferis TaxID=1397668 RepID=A0AAW7ZD83_9FIRM|nr:ACT domain-containing protein [Desulforamulus aquiferis]MDO7787667.1 ACT domain-containing protein [Desulforamulus aquiferis]RYD05961.1 hypothetical protein N752_06865 [Desulforamulus aquiferis]
MDLSILEGTFAVCRLQPGVVPGWAFSNKDFVSVTSTEEEVSIVCNVANVPQGVICEQPWVVIKVRGPLDFGLTGILASLANPLAKAGISIFAVSTFDTDYLLVKMQDLPKARQILLDNGHCFDGFALNVAVSTV